MPRTQAIGLFPLFLWVKDPISSEAGAGDDPAAVSYLPETATVAVRLRKSSPQLPSRSLASDKKHYSELITWDDSQPRDRLIPRDTEFFVTSFVTTGPTCACFCVLSIWETA